MREGKDARASISVRPTGRTWPGAPMVRVLVDGVSVGVLKDKNVATYQVPVGRHQIQVRRDFVKSKVLEFDLATGQCAFFEYGVNHAGPRARMRVVRNIGLLALIPFVVLTTALGLPRTPSAITFAGLGVIAGGIVGWQSFVPAGVYLHLRKVNS
jgi:hypothetical protein